jgi:uncharacterized OB-fold protein
MAETDLPFRILPYVNDRNRHFWEGGRDGKLQFLRCEHDGYFVHPPTPRCPICLSKDLKAEAVSGKATLVTYTVNHQAWMPGPELPYVVAIVSIDEQPDVRLTTNLVNCELDDIEIGMPVQVTFENRDDEVWIPLFEPADASRRKASA